MDDFLLAKKKSRLFGNVYREKSNMDTSKRSDEDRKLHQIVQQLDHIIGNTKGAISIIKAGPVKGYELSADRNGFLSLGTEVLRAGLCLKDKGPLGGLSELEPLRIDPSTSISCFSRNDDLRDMYSDTDSSSSKKQSYFPFVLMMAVPVVLGGMFLFLIIVGAITVAEWLAARM